MKPKEVKIVGQAFAIEWAEKPGGLSLDSAYGVTLIPEQKLVIRDDLAPDQRRDTVLHEILHASLMVLGFEDNSERERLVGCLAPALLDVLRSNPSVTGWLLA